jgi:hypothetical protein
MACHATYGRVVGPARSCHRALKTGRAAPPARELGVNGPTGIATRLRETYRAVHGLLWLSQYGDAPRHGVIPPGRSLDAF